jgi:NAD(P)-dependent dehydrogenase (short-subunit alcohol dehydrogenase family)
MVDLRDILIHSLNLDPHSFDGKVVVVTGAGRGIGFQTARSFAMLGGSVVIAELSDDGYSVEDQIRHEGGAAKFVRTDVSDMESVKNLRQIVEQSIGPVDVLVNNAIRIASSPVLEMDVEIWDRIIAVNLRGTFLTCKAFLPGMLACQHGTIINMISTEAMPGLAAYIASKQGILGFSQSLALEVGSSGIRVIPFGPGMVNTPGIRSVAEDLAPRLGMTLTARHGQWWPIPTTYTYRWYRKGIPIKGATGATYQLVAHGSGEFDGLDLRASLVWQAGKGESFTGQILEPPSRRGRHGRR